MSRIKVRSLITGREGVATKISDGYQVIDMEAENIAFFTSEDFRKRFKILGGTNLNPSPDWFREKAGIKPQRKAEEQNLFA